jgi:predicted transcriptional regulator
MPRSFKQLLEKIASEKAPGPSASFSVFHILRAMELISEKQIGRGMLAKKLSVGEGAIRTIIDRLKEAGLISTSKAGCILTKKGSQFSQEYRSIFEKKVAIERNELALADYNFAILIKNRGHKVKRGVEQRDAAVMTGARGATTIMLKNRRLVIPSVSENVAKDFPKAANQATRLLQPSENDVIIIVSADNLEKAEYGTLAAAWTLLNDC